MGVAYQYRQVSLQDEMEGEEDRKKYRRPVPDCSRGSKLCMLVMAAVIITLAVLLMWAWRAVSTEVCLTPECVDVSAYIMRKMNRSVDPCHDFYAYSCGGWLDSTFIPPERAKYDTFSEVNTNNQAILKRLLDDSSTMYRGQNSTAVAKLKTYYRTCMNVTKMEEDSTEPIQKWIERLGSWSIAPGSSSRSTATRSGNTTEEWDLTAVLANFHKWGQAPILGFGVLTDFKNNSRNLLTFIQSGLTLRSHIEYIKNADKLKEAFMKFAVTTGKLLGGDNSTRDKMEAIYTFEKSLAEIFVKKEELIDPNAAYTLLTVQEFQKMIGDQLDVLRLMTSIVDRNISESQVIVVPHANYFRKLGPVLANTSRQVLQDYMIWHMIQRLPGYLPQQFVDATRALDKAELGVTAISPRWQRCVSKADSAFGFASSALYIEKTFPSESKAESLKILEGVQSAFISNLDTLKWMDHETRQRAKVKASTMDKVLGYPEWLLDPKKLDKRYEKVQVKEGEMLNNFFAVSASEVAKLWEDFDKKPDKNDWSMMPNAVNAFFSSTYNHIIILAGLLQRPYFDLNFPRSFAYGSMGSISGHELTHGFDNSGRKFDEKGNMNDWWSNQSAEAFDQHSRCMIDQYSHFSISEENLNGQYTLGENIADNGGLKLGYTAYQAAKAKRSEDKEFRLPGLDLTPDQLYFLGFAQIWCAYYTPQYAKTSILSDSHANSRFRVLGSVANSPQFAQAFSCPVDSPLNPRKKCNVW